MLSPVTLDDLIVDCGAEMTPQLNAAIQSRLERDRAVLLRNTGMTRLAEMAEWASFIGAEQMDYSYGTGLREPMGAGVLSVGSEPHFTNVDPHNEMAYWTFYPRLILFGCERIPARGGDTVIADNCRVTEDLVGTGVEQKILQRGICYIRNFTDRNYPDSIPSMKHWQDSFGFESWQELEDYCAGPGWNLLQRPDGSVQVSYPEQGYEFDPVSGKNLLFTSMARLGRAFDNWPPYNDLPGDQRPYHLRYADGSEFSADDLATLDRVFERHSVPIKWQPGDIALLDNIAWTHARPPFELAEGEVRSIGVLVSQPVDRRRIMNL